MFSILNHPLIRHIIIRYHKINLTQKCITITTELIYKSRNKLCTKCTIQTYHNSLTKSKNLNSLGLDTPFMRNLFIASRRQFKNGVYYKNLIFIK